MMKIPTTGMPMSCLAWNSRGLDSPQSIHELKNLIQSERPNILFFMETKLPKECMLSLRHVLGFNCGVVVSQHVG